MYVAIGLVCSLCMSFFRYVFRHFVRSFRLSFFRYVLLYVFFMYVCVRYLFRYICSYLGGDIAFFRMCYFCMYCFV